MITFALACAGLVLFSGLFYLFPHRHRPLSDSDMAEANLEWYRLRRQEIINSGADEGLERDAQLRLLEDERSAVEATGRAAASSFPCWALLPVVALASSLLYYCLGGASDVVLNQRLQALNESASPTEVYAIMAAVEDRVAQRPDNLHYRALLGRYYMAQESYVEAAKAYDALVEAAPEDAFALAYAAQARYLAAGRQLSEEAQHMAEQALSINPHQRTALGLLGMAAFEQEQYRAAITYWERLQAMEQAGSESAQMIAGVIAQARERLGGPSASAPIAGAHSGESAHSRAGGDAADTLGLTVRVALPEGARVAPSDTVFVLARNPQSASRMPIAVQRLSAGQLPMTVRLDNSLSMAGQTLKADEPVVVVVQVSPSGQPGERNATYLGSSEAVLPSSDGPALELLLQPRS